jgi:hypothetical protein
MEPPGAVKLDGRPGQVAPPAQSGNPDGGGRVLVRSGAGGRQIVTPRLEDKVCPPFFSRLLGGRGQENDRRKRLVVCIEAAHLETEAIHRVGAQRFTGFRVVHGLVPEKDDGFFTGADRLNVGRIGQAHGVQAA